MAVITGIALDSSGVVLTSGAIQFDFIPPAVLPDEPTTIFPHTVTVQIPDDGVLNFTLNDGSYDAVYRADPQSNGVTFKFQVPGNDTPFNACLVEFSQ